MTDIPTGIVLINPPKAILRVRPLFQFEIDAYAARYNVEVDHRRVPLDMRVKDAATLHERRCREAYHEFTHCRDVPKLPEADEAAADWQFENDQLDRELFDWPHPNI